jgi:hypothetical protein
MASHDWIELQAADLYAVVRPIGPGHILRQRQEKMSDAFRRIR